MNTRLDRIDPRVTAALPLLLLVAWLAGCETPSTDTSPDQAASQPSAPQITDCFDFWERYDDGVVADSSAVPEGVTGAVATVDRRPVTIEDFRTIHAWLTATRQPALTADSLQDRAEYAAHFYAIRWRLDAAGISVSPGAVSSAVDRLRADLGVADDPEATEALTGYRPDELAVQTCRRLRLEAYIDRRADGTDLSSADVDRRAVRTFGFAALRPHYQVLEDNLPEPPTDGSGATNADITLVLRVEKGGMRVHYPGFSFQQTETPEALLSELVLPVGRRIDLEVAGTDAARTILLPDLGVRLLALPETYAYHALEVGTPPGGEGPESTLPALLDWQVRFHRRPLAPLALKDVEVWRIDSKSPSGDEELAATLRAADREQRDLPVALRSPKSFRGFMLDQRYNLPAKHLYTRQCAGCHQEDGRGSGREYPSLVDSPWTTGDKPVASLIRVAVFGSHAAAMKERADKENRADTVMSIEARRLPPKVTARIINYVTSSWGNDGPTVTAEEVRSVACATEPGLADRLPTSIDPDTLPERLRRAEEEGRCDTQVRRQLEQLTDPERIPEGTADLYADNCATCHGSDGTRGPAGRWIDPPATLFGQADAWNHGRTALDAYRAITSGIADTAMTSYRQPLSRRQRWDLARYVVGQLPPDERADEPETDRETLCRRQTRYESLRIDSCAESK